MRQSQFFGLCAALIAIVECRANANQQPASTKPIPLQPKMSELAPGKSLHLSFKLPAARSVALQIKFKDADFSGATILTKVNGLNMLPITLLAATRAMTV